MKVIEQHTTPDGLLKFTVEDFGDDFALGFEGFPWHTHPECLSQYPKGDSPKIIRQFIDALLADQQIIALRRVNGKLVDAWVTDVPMVDVYKPKNEEIVFRYWSGKLCERMTA